MPAHTNGSRAKRSDASLRNDRGRELSLAPAQAFPLVRDLFFIGAILCYVIGFAYQTAKMQRFGFGAAIDRGATATFACAFDALRAGVAGYAFIAFVAVALFVFAAVLKTRFGNDERCRFAMVGALCLSVAVLVVGSCCYAWQQGLAGGHETGTARSVE